MKAWHPISPFTGQPIGIKPPRQETVSVTRAKLGLPSLANETAYACRASGCLLAHRNRQPSCRSLAYTACQLSGGSVPAYDA